jgi:hypothetical protein
MRKVLSVIFAAAVLFPISADALMTSAEWNSIVGSKTQELYQKTGNLAQAGADAQAYANQLAASSGGFAAYNPNQPSPTYVSPVSTTTQTQPASTTPVDNPFSNPLFLLFFLTPH